MKKFLLFLFLLTAICAGVFWWMGQSRPDLLHPYAWYILGYHVFLTLVTFAIQWFGLKSGGPDFFNYIMGTSAIRLLVSASLLFAYYYLINVEKIGFTVTFFALYFVYSAFEIIAVLPNLRQNF